MNEYRHTPVWAPGRVTLVLIGWIFIASGCLHSVKTKGDDDALEEGEAIDFTEEALREDGDCCGDVSRDGAESPEGVDDGEDSGPEDVMDGEDLPVRPEVFLVGWMETQIVGMDTYETTITYPALGEGEEAEPDTRFAPYPAVVFAHGYGATNIYTWLCRFIASRGYVVLAFRVRDLGFSDMPEKSKDAILRSLDYLETELAATLLAGMVDLDRIGVSGHSMGGMSTLAATSQDGRIKTAVSLAPYDDGYDLLPDEYMNCGAISVPVQLVAGSGDFLCPPENALGYYDQIPSTREVLVVSGAFHDIGITDIIVIEEQRVWREITSRYMLNWLAMFLYGDDSVHDALFGDAARRDLEDGLLTELHFVVVD